MNASRYPAVIKLGHAHGGIGKARAETSQEFLDLASLAAMTNAYCTSEPYIDTKYDVHVQKIGNNYKAFMYVPRTMPSFSHITCKLTRILFKGKRPVNNLQHFSKYLNIFGKNKLDNNFNFITSHPAEI